MSRKELYHLEESCCCCFQWPYPEGLLHSFKTKGKKMSSYGRKKTDCALPHTLNIFFSSLCQARRQQDRRENKTSKAKIGLSRSGKGLVRFSHHVLLHECTLLSLSPANIFFTFKFLYDSFFRTFLLHFQQYSRLLLQGPRGLDGAVGDPGLPVSITPSVLLQSVVTDLACRYANLLEQEKAFT